MSATSPSPTRRRTRSAGVSVDRRLDVAMRVLVAAPGNYAATWLSTALLARTLPGGALSATVTATLLAFVLFACGVVASFAARDGARAGAGLAAVSAVAAAALAVVGIGA